MPSMMPRASINSAQWVKTLGTEFSDPVFSKCSDKSQPKTRSLRIPDFFNLPRAGRERMKLRKKLINFPCFRSTGLVGSWPEGLVGLPPADPGLGLSSSPSEPIEFLRKRWLSRGRFRPCGTLSPMTSTHSQGKKPTSNPRFPRHHIDSSGGGISITEIMSPTCNNQENQEWKWGTSFRQRISRMIDGLSTCFSMPNNSKNRSPTIYIFSPHFLARKFKAFFLLKIKYLP